MLSKKQVRAMIRMMKGSTYPMVFVNEGKMVVTNGITAVEWEVDSGLKGVITEASLSIWLATTPNNILARLELFDMIVENGREDYVVSAVTNALSKEVNSVKEIAFSMKNLKLVADILGTDLVHFEFAGELQPIKLVDPSAVGTVFPIKIR